MISSKVLLLSILAAGSVHASWFSKMATPIARSSREKVVDGKPSAYPVDHHGNRIKLSKRDDSPSIPDLLNSCPGGKGSSLPQAHVCWFVFDQNNGDAYDKKIELDGVKRIENCGGGQGQLTETISGTHSWSSGYSITTTESFDFFGISSSFSQKYSHTTSQANVTGFSMTIPPGKKGTLQTTQHFQPSLGHININYGEHDKVAGHWNWIVNSVSSDQIRGPPVVGSVELNCSDPYPF